MRPARRLAAFLLCAAAAGLACGGDDDGADGGGPDPDSLGYEELFDPDRVLEVVIELDPADWDALRTQTRSVLDILGGDCLAQPFASPFTYVPSAVTIDGVVFPEVGLRKKGFLGSLSEERPSLKVKLDEYVAGQELGGLDKLTFNNSQQDPSLFRQCLAYQVFEAAGAPTPRCNYAHLTINGRDMGVFVHVESLDKEFLERRFDDATGRFYEGTLSDFRPEFMGTFELKTNDVADDRADLAAVTDALAAPDGELLAALDAEIDLDGFYDFWAAEVLTSHWDGYASNTNNFYLYRDPASDRFHFVPWGTDGAFGPNVLLDDPAAPPVSVFATGALARRLYLHPTGRADYLARLEAQLGSIWDEARLLAEVDRMEALVAPLVEAPGHGAAVDELRAVIEQQREAIEAELAAGPPEWDQELRDPICLATIGTIDVSFETTWGTHGAEDPFAAGTGAWAVTASGAELTEVAVGATAGDDPEGPHAILQAFAYLDTGHVAVLFLQVERAHVAPGSLEVDWGRVFGGVYDYDPATGAVVLVGLVGAGTLTLDEASTEAGAPVAGRVQAELVLSPF